jgi:putative NADH-flavin reductase
MRLLILGGTGGVGQHMVSAARRAGHRLTLLVRPETPFELSAGSDFRVVRGDVLAGEALHEAMDGAEAVLSTIGMQRLNPANPWSKSRSPADLTSVAAARIVASMKGRGVRRVVAVSAAGVGDSAPGLNLLMRFFLATTMIGPSYRDLARMELVFAQSGLDWLAPRPTRLTNAAATGRIAVVDHFGLNAAISRADVATFMLRALEVPSWPTAEWRSRTPQISSA